MTNWKPIEVAPKDRPFLARQAEMIYKCRYGDSHAWGITWLDEGLPSDQLPEPEEWCEIPE